MRRLMVLVFSFWLASLPGQAGPLRVTTWDLEWTAVETSEQKRLQTAAAILRKLEADIIILQHIRDEETSQRLADYLKPATYYVAVCSAFNRDGIEISRPHQVAILSKQPALAAWADDWKGATRSGAPGGYAFAAIRCDARLVGIYSTQLEGNSPGDRSDLATQLKILRRERAAEQLINEINSMGKRFKNSIDAVIVAGNFNTNPDESLFVSESTLQLFDQAGFSSAFQDLPPGKRITAPENQARPAATLDYVFGKNVVFVGEPRIFPTALAAHFPLTAVVDVQEGAAAAKTAYPAPPSFTNLKIVWLAGGLLAASATLCFMFWRFAKQNIDRLSPARVADAESPESIITCPGCAEPIAVALDANGQLQTMLASSAQAQEPWRAPAEGRPPSAPVSRWLHAKLIPHLARMMMNKLVNTLIFQRRHLIQTQQRAASRVNEMEERLTRLPPQLQARIKAYERRIAELEKELGDKGEENRELIRAQIILVKQELEAEKSKNRLKWN